MKRIICIVLAIITALCLSTAVFAASDGAKLEDLDNSSINGKVTTYVGVTESVVFYPVPLEAEDQFDIRNAEIIVEDDSIVSVKAQKVEEYRFGSIEITGLKRGTTKVTVKDASGISSTLKVTVRPKIIYDIQNFRNFLEYLPFYIFMAIMRLFGGKIA